MTFQKGDKIIGRPRGAKNRVHDEIRRKLLKKYKKTPLEYMMAVIFSDDKGVSQSRRDDMAKAAAPYFHARIVDSKEKDHGPKPPVAKTEALGDFESRMARLVEQEPVPTNDERVEPRLPDQPSH